jgi:molecular chaperone GrpE
VKIIEYKDRLLRTLSEFANYRKRVENEKQAIIKYSNVELIIKLLPVLDDFDSFFKKKFDISLEIYKGFEIIYKRLLSILEKEGLVIQNTINQKFDPNKHEAVEQVETDKYEEGTILEEVQRGYEFNGEVIRPAKVKVARKIQKNNEKNKDNL